LEVIIVFIASLVIDKLKIQIQKIIIQIILVDIHIIKISITKEAIKTIITSKNQSTDLLMKQKIILKDH
jgi:hypothetical protein